MIDGFAKPILLPEVNESGEDGKGVFLKTLGFGFLNFISVGVVGSFQEIVNKNRVKVLELEQGYLQTKAQEILSQWETIEADLQRLRDQINSQGAQSIPLDREITDLTHKINQLKDENVPPFLSKSEGITRLALDCILFFGNWIANIITLGAYGTYQNYVLEKRIALLEKQNTFVNQTLVHDLKQSKSERLIQQVNGITNNLKIQKTLEEIRNTDPTTAREEIRRIGQAIIPLGQELQVLNQQVAAAEAEKIRLSQENQAVQLQVNFFKKGNVQLEQDRIRLQQNADNQINKIVKLREKAADHVLNIQKIKDAQIRTVELEKEIQNLQAAKENLPQVRRIQSQLGPLSKYTKRAQDAEIEGAYGINSDSEDENDLMSEYAKRYNGKKTAVEVVQASLDFAISRLLELGGQANPKIHFNHSAMIYSDGKFAANKNAVYRFMAWDFIEHGKLIQDGCAGFVLRLNVDEIAMGSSHPERVQTYRIDPVSHSRHLEVKILPTHNDDFTPPVGDRDLLFGIDPASAKWIHARLNREEKNHLYHLLMEPLMANDCAELIAVQEFMKNGNPEQVKLVRTAYDLICNIALSFDKKFAGSGLLNHQWSRLDEWDGTVLPFEKPGMLMPDTPLAALPQVNWIPNTDCIIGVSDGHTAEQCDFAVAFLEAQIEYARIFADFSRNLVKNPLDQAYPAKVHNRGDWGEIRGIKHQYYLSHEVGRKVLDAGCLFSNLLIVLMNKRDQVTEKNATCLKKALAKYLDDAANADAFKDYIFEAHRMSVDQYKNWLRGIRGVIDNYALGDLEIELTARVFGIRIGVFEDEQSTKINEHGLMVPDGEKYYFGPNTKEMLYLYNMPGTTFYGLWPKLKSGVLNGEAEAANRSIIKYRNQIDSNDI